MGDACRAPLGRLLPCCGLCLQQPDPGPGGGLVRHSARGDTWMSKHSQLVCYHSILPVLHQPGCPFCRLLKDFQADRLQKHAQGEMHHLCNFHIWGLAAVKDAPDAAKIFLDLVNEAAPSSAGAASCDICPEVAPEEDLRVREFLS